MSQSVIQNNQQINAMQMSAEAASTQMRFYKELQDKYVEVQRSYAALQTESLAMKHEGSDFKLKLEQTQAENALL